MGTHSRRRATPQGQPDQSPGRTAQGPVSAPGSVGGPSDSCAEPGGRGHPHTAGAAGPRVPVPWTPLAARGAGLCPKSPLGGAPCRRAAAGITWVTAPSSPRLRYHRMQLDMPPPLPSLRRGAASHARRGQAPVPEGTRWGHSTGICCSLRPQNMWRHRPAYRRRCRARGVRTGHKGLELEPGDGSPSQAVRGQHARTEPQAPQLPVCQDPCVAGGQVAQVGGQGSVHTREATRPHRAPGCPQSTGALVAAGVARPRVPHTLPLCGPGRWQQGPRYPELRAPGGELMSLSLAREHLVGGAGCKRER